MLGFDAFFFCETEKNKNIKFNWSSPNTTNYSSERKSSTSTLYNKIRSPVPVFLLALVLGSVHALFSLDAAWLNVSAKAQKMSL